MKGKQCHLLPPPCALSTELLYDIKQNIIAKRVFFKGRIKAISLLEAIEASNAFNNNNLNFMSNISKIAFHSDSFLSNHWSCSFAKSWSSCWGDLMKCLMDFLNMSQKCDEVWLKNSLCELYSYPTTTVNVAKSVPKYPNISWYSKTYCETIRLDPIQRDPF